MDDERNERSKKPTRKSRVNTQKRKTSRLYDLVIASFNAAKYGNNEELRFIFTSETLESQDECNMIINSKDKEGNTLILKCIHGAASARQLEPHCNFIECLNFLISIGVDVNSRDSLLRTSLHWAVLYGRLDFLEVLQNGGGNLLLHDSSGLNPLHLAIGIKSEKLRDNFIEFICASAPNELLEADDSLGRNPLFLALSVHALRTFENLLIVGANPDSPGPDDRKVIIHAIERGQGKFIQLLLRHGASLTSKDPDGFSVIHLAACQENPESIIILTKTLNKTLLNVKDHLGRTPLIYACLMGFDKNVELLLEQKIWILDQDDEGKTALHHTISNTHCGCAELLCKENRKIVHISDKEGRTPAHDAVITGNSNILDCLLKYGCDVNFKDHGGHSLIHWAAAYGTLSCFEQLLECNSPMEEVDDHGATPLHYGCQKDNDEKLTSVRLEVIKTLLGRGVKLTVTDNQGRQPIHWASTSGNAAAFEILLGHGDDVNSQTLQEKMTSLHVCAAQGHEDIVRYLLKQKGVKMNAQDKQKCTPLFYACSAGHSDVAQMLLQAGADANICNGTGESPSHTAAMFGSVDCLQLLLKGGADLSVANDQQDTPLHDAASAGKESVVKFLIENGCQTTVRNLTGATPLHYSVAEGHFSITKMLLEYGACANALVTTNETDFVTPLDIALGNSDSIQIQLLQKFGAKTGHCIVHNSALVIQHRWKVFKRRFSSFDSICQSNLSDSVSNHEPAEFNSTKHEVRKDSISVYVEEQSKAETRDHNGDNDRYGNNVDYKKEDECSKNSTRGEGSMKVCKKKEFISVNFPSGNDGNLETESFDREKVKELKMSIVERLSSSRAQCAKTDELILRAEKLRNRAEEPIKEIGKFAERKKLDSLVSCNERILLRNRSLQTEQTLSPRQIVCIKR